MSRWMEMRVLGNKNWIRADFGTVLDSGIISSASVTSYVFISSLEIVFFG